jgi:hypothetical protein
MTTNNQRNEIKYNKVVNVAEDGEITVLDYVFTHSDSFKGAVGSKFYPVSESEYNERMSEDSVIDSFIDSGMELPKGHERNGWQSVYDTMSESEIESFMFDTSYRELWEYLRSTCGLSLNDAAIFNCVGGGRCFDANFSGNKNKQLSKIIRKYESK